jgi:hypothetical protein
LRGRLSANPEGQQNRAEIPGHDGHNKHLTKTL